MKPTIFFLVAAMLLGCITPLPVMAEVSAEVQLLDNGSFESCIEQETADGVKYLWPAGWTQSGIGTVGTDYKIVNENAHGGKYAMMISGSGTDNTARITREIKGLIPGQVYEISAWLRINEEFDSSHSGAFMYARQYSYGGDDFARTGESITTTKGKWINTVTNFVASETGTVSIWIAKHGTAAVYYDDVTVSPVKNFISNGGFEHYNDDRALIWKTGTASWGSDAKLDDSAPFNGKYSAKLERGDSFISVDLKTKAAFPLLSIGQEYTLSFAAKASSKVEIEYLDAETNEAYDAVKKDFSGDNNNWTTYSLKFTPPADCGSVRLKLCASSKSSVYYDDISVWNDSLNDLYEKASLVAKPEPLYLKDPVSGKGEEFINGDLENMTAGWKIYKAANGETPVTLGTEDPQSGSCYLKIKTSNPSFNPWGMLVVDNVLAGAEYQISVWLRKIAVSTDKGPYIKFEFYSGHAVGQGECTGNVDSQSFNQSATSNAWTQVATRISVPYGSNCMAVYFRLHGAGEIYWDNASCVLTEMPKTLKADTDQIYYYTGSRGEYDVNIETSVYPIEEGSYMDFAIRDGDKVLANENFVKAESNVKYTFDSSIFDEIGKPYIVEVQYKSHDGKLIESDTETVYRYPRPAVLREDCTYIKDGKVFDPVLGYHITEADMPYAIQAGVNVFQGFSGTGPQKPLDSLNAAMKVGAMSAVSVYRDMKPGGSSYNVENTREIVEAVKDHPALFGYIVMDEPFLHGSQDQVYADLLNSYKIIRDIDPVHPVIILETPYNSSLFEVAGKLCDILVTDPYPAAASKMATWPAQIAKKAKEAVNYKKPVYSVLQAFDYQGYLPQANDMRHMLYTSLFEGVEGLGYYSFREWTDPPTLVYNYTDTIWKGMTAFANNEQEEAFDVFVHGKYPIINQVMGDKVWWISYIKDENVYVIALNITNEYAEIDIPLTSYDKSVQLGKFSAKAVDISGEPDVSGDGNMRLDLRGGAVVKYKINLNDPVDFSSLKAMTYRDLGRYSWARAQIEDLTIKGIVNNANSAAYLPGINITRADFAMFLIRTLGLTSDNTENFADVDSTAYYSKELAIGKAAGILNGIGDNKFNPMADISRQDMMTICARGMSYAKKLNETGNASDVAAFSDAALISDYAVSSITALVRESIVKGNADGTINPLGNTTRAEAAVIMSRILSK